MVCMSKAPTTDRYEFRLRHRLLLALELGGLGVQEMAEYLGLSRNTVSSYLHDRSTPTKAVLRAWAARCDVSFEWLATGENPGQGYQGARLNPLPDGPAAPNSHLTPAADLSDQTAQIDTIERHKPNHSYQDWRQPIIAQFRKTAQHALDGWDEGEEAA